MSRVIFFIKTPLPTNKAKAFGDVHILINDDIPNSTNLPRLQTRILDELEGIAYDPQEDYLAITGSIAHVTLGFLIVHSEYGDPIKYLLFDGRTNDYKAREYYNAGGYRTVKQG